MIVFVFFAFALAEGLRIPGKSHNVRVCSTALRSAAGDLIVGINKYSHDASLCIVSAESGEVLFSLSKERLTGSKNDGGATGSLLAYGLNSIYASIDDVKVVVNNNHHFRVNPFEKRIKNLYRSLNNVLPSADYNDDLNLLSKEKYPHIEKLELSHHLAHAWWALSSAPFESGLILVMDGMGESYKAMFEDMMQIEEHSGDYMHDLRLIKSYASKGAPFIGQPSFLQPGSGYREAETAYVFDAKTATLRPVFKRWSRERSPPELFNHGFENMESIGAVYSRISSYIFGDWNACGKVMGLAPWANKNKMDAGEWFFTNDAASSNINSLVDLGKDFYHKNNIMSGNPLLEGEDGLQIDWNLLEEGLGDFLLPSSISKEAGRSKFGYLAGVAQSVQSDLEKVVLELSASLREATGESKMVLAGGVALNSVVNGMLQRGQGGFEEVHIGCAPGDEGIAVGCAMYGLQRYREKKLFEEEQQSVVSTDSAEAMPSMFDFPRPNVERAIASVMDNGPDDPLHGDSSMLPDESIKDVPNDLEKENRKVVAFQQQQFSPYQGRAFTEDEIGEALYELDPWLDLGEAFESEEAMVEDAARTIADGHVIAWVQGRAEFGQRALGSRSILADPRRVELRRKINEKIKEREWFRPLAPSVLDEEAGDWFDGLESGMNASPYMTITTQVKAEKTSLVPAVCHIDDSARLQTVTSEDSSLYHSLIKSFFKLTGIPMVLNTSFNRKGQPIIESPLTALKTFLECKGEISYIFIGNRKIAVKKGLDPILSDNKKSSNVPSEREGGLYIRAAPLYLWEMTSAPSDTKGDSSKIRIQDGGIRYGDDILSDPRMTYDYNSNSAGESSSTSQPPSPSSDSGDDIWRTLPSNLHLEILQLLQDLKDLDFSEDGYQSPEESTDDDGDITVLELFEALRQAASSEEEDEDCSVLSEEEPNSQFNWPLMKSALQWLHKNLLISFIDPDSDADFEKLFAGNEVLDLRGLS